jgi:hypothetical protein
MLTKPIWVLYKFPHGGFKQMKTKDLITIWGAPEPPRLAPKQFSIRLPMLVSAKISALCEMYPKKTKTEIIGDLLTTALDQLEQDLPSVQGRPVGDDPETGETIYEDIGMCASFRRKTEKYLREIEKEAGITDPIPYVTNCCC